MTKAEQLRKQLEEAEAEEKAMQERAIGAEESAAAQRDMVIKAPTEVGEALDLGVGNWGATEEIESGDIQIPSILIMQAKSQLVEVEEVAKPGDIVENLTFRVLGDAKKPAELIIFDQAKTLQTYRMNGTAKEYVSTEPLNASNEHLLRANDGYLRYTVYNYFCLVVGDGDEAFPHVLKLKASGVRAAKKLNAMFVKMKARGRVSASVVMEFVTQKDQDKEGHVYHKVDVKQGRDTTLEELKAAYEWWKQLRQTDVMSKVVGGDEDAVTVESMAPGNPVDINDDDIPF